MLHALEASWCGLADGDEAKDPTRNYKPHLMFSNTIPLPPHPDVLPHLHFSSPGDPRHGGSGKVHKVSLHVLMFELADNSSGIKMKIEQKEEKTRRRKNRIP